MKEVIYNKATLYFLSDEFSDCEIKYLPMDLDWAVIDYRVGGYDGYGDIIFKKDGKFHLHNCSHCSCYGPTDEIELNTPYNSLKDIMISEDYKKDLEPIFEFIKERGLV